MPRDDFADHCVELLATAGTVRRRRMFGGHGLYVDDLFVGVIAGERLYLKADAQTAPPFEAAGGERFVYSARGRTVALGFWSPPPEAMDSPALMAPWVRLAVQAALGARAAPLRRRKAPAPAPAAARSRRRTPSPR
jgi:DNA transformation protein